MITLDETIFENFQLLISENLSFSKSGFFQYKRSSDFYCSINSVENFEESTCLSDREILPHPLLMMKTLDVDWWIIQTHRAQMMKIILGHHQEKEDLW